MHTKPKLSSRNQAVIIVVRCSCSSHAEFVVGGGRLVFPLSFFKFLSPETQVLSERERERERASNRARSGVVAEEEEEEGCACVRPGLETQVLRSRL